MAEAKLYGQNKGGMSINGIIKDYYAYAGENISAGVLVEYVNGVAGKTDYGESVDTQLSTETNTGYKIAAVKLDESRVFIAHSYGSSYYLYGAVCTINGAAITCGPDIQLSAATYSGMAISAKILPNGKVFVAHDYETNHRLWGMLVSIEGTEIKVVTDTQLSGTSNTGYAISTELLPNGSIFIAHSYNTSYHLYGMICTISDTKISYSDTAIATTSKSGYFISTCLLPNGNVFIAHSYGSNYYLYGVVCSISGTTISKGTDTSLSTSNYGEDTEISVQPLSNGDVFVVYTYGNSRYLYGIVCSIEGTKVTKGTETALSTESNAGYRISTVLLGENKYLVLHIISNVAYLYGMICEIDGSNIITGPDTQILNGNYISYTYDNILLNNGTIFVAHSKETSYYLNAQIFGIDEANNIPTNNIVIPEYETQVRKVTTGQFGGIAKTSGEGGDNTGHKDMVSIWTKVKEEIPEGTQQIAMADGNTLCCANGDIFVVKEMSA